MAFKKKKMKITEDKINNLYGTLKVHIQADEYQTQVNDAIKGYRKKINMPGFRSGNVPVSLIKKKYGISIKVEEINKIISKELTDYLQKNKLPIFGYPIPKESKVDWSSDENYVFEYDLGYKPSFKIVYPKQKDVKFYEIKVDKKQLDDNISDLRMRFGKNVFPDKAKKDDMLFVKIDEVVDGKEKNKDLISHSSSMLVSKIEDEKFKKQVLNSKKGDVINFDPKKAFTNELDLASFLGVDKQLLNNISKKFSCKIESIKRTEPSDLNIDFFKKAFPEKDIKSEEEMRKELTINFQNMYLSHSDNKFFKDSLDFIIENSKIELPDNFLKKLLNSNAEKKMEEKELEKQYESYKKSFHWELIKEKIMTDDKIEISEELIFEESKSILWLQFKQYGMTKNDDELNDFANNLLKNKEEKQRIIDQIINKKIIDHLKNRTKIIKKSISLDDFTKLA